MEYIPVLIMLGIGVLVSTLIMIVSSALGVKAPHPRKNEPFECGVPPHGDTKRRFSVRFYLIAILFLLFDVEIIFFFPFALVFRDFMQVNSFIAWEMGIFTFVLLAGYIYVYRKGALEWE